MLKSNFSFEIFKLNSAQKGEFNEYKHFFFVVVSPVALEIASRII